MHRRRMQKKTILYLGNGDPKQNSLKDHLNPLKLDLHQVSSIAIAKSRLAEQQYHLLLIQFEHIRDHIFDFCAL